MIHNAVVEQVWSAIEKAFWQEVLALELYGVARVLTHGQQGDY